MIWSRFFTYMTLGVCAFMLTAALVLGTVRHALTLPSPSAQIQYLYIEPGDSLRQIAQTAKEIGLVERSWHFWMAARYLRQETRLQAGEFEITPATTISAIINKVVAGGVYYRRIVVPEGLSIQQIEGVLINSPGLNWEGYSAPVEGSLLPETYYYTRGESVKTVVARMRAKMDDTLDALWAVQASGLPVTSKEQVLVLASIVEKETGTPEERGLVAAVFLNRLKQRMRLQSDPTVVYGLTYGLPLGRRLTSADLKMHTPYNTYRIAGLPPLPIANPGRASIEAVLLPADVPYLYFVADGTGGHAFATTLKDHNRNVAHWRRVRDEHF